MVLIYSSIREFGIFTPCGNELNDVVLAEDELQSGTASLTVQYCHGEGKSGVNRSLSRMRHALDFPISGGEFIR